MSLVDKYEDGEYVSPTQWATRVYDLEKSLLKIEDLVYQNQLIPVSIREEIQRTIIFEAGITPKKK